MRNFITAAVLMVSANCYSQALYPAHPTEVGAKFECTTCKVDFSWDAKGSYIFYPYRPFGVKPQEGFQWTSLPPNVTIKFVAKKDQKYYIALHLLPWKPYRTYQVTGSGNYKHIANLLPGNEIIELIYTAGIAGEVFLTFSSTLEDPWMARSCKIVAVNF